MEKAEYPKFKYHPGLKPVIVRSKEAEEALGKAWGDSPADFGIETAPGAEADAEIAANKPKTRSGAKA